MSTKAIKKQQAHKALMIMLLAGIIICCTEQWIAGIIMVITASIIITATYWLELKQPIQWGVQKKASPSAPVVNSRIMVNDVHLIIESSCSLKNTDIVIVNCRAQPGQSLIRLNWPSLRPCTEQDARMLQVQMDRLKTKGNSVQKLEDHINARLRHKESNPETVINPQA